MGLRGGVLDSIVRCASLVSLGRSRRSSSTLLARLVNSLGTRPDPTGSRIVSPQFWQTSSLPTNWKSDRYRIFDRLVLGRFYRRPGSLGSAWSTVKVFERTT